MTALAIGTGRRAPVAAADRKPWLASVGGRWFSPILLLLLWELGSRSGLIPERTLAAPSAVLGTLFQMTISGELPSNLLVSFGRVAFGLLIGVGLGIALGLTAGLSRRSSAPSQHWR